MNSILHKEYRVFQNDFINAGKASSNIKQTLAQLGIKTAILRRISVASYEAEINMIIHADGGVISLDVFEDGKIRIVFHDTGKGIPDIAKAMTEGWSTASEEARDMGFGAGMGLPNIKRVSDEFDLQSSPAGTILTVGFIGE